jgi:hypothetical protein
MIHIATVHWQDDTWVDIQLNYLQKFIKADNYHLYACLNGIETDKYRDRIHYINSEPIQAHYTKLNLLADTICREADPDDHIYFIDGDAFPIGDIQSFVNEALKEFKLVAIKRLENGGDPQPHPSFCATSVRFWQEIEGDWGHGPQWTCSNGRTRTDTGGLLWDNLRKRGIQWKPMLRSNKFDLHPLWFGIYSDVIYHHGAAFRTPLCMVDINNARKIWWKKLLMNIADTPLGSFNKGWVQNALYSFVMKNDANKAWEQSRELITDIKENYRFSRRFMQ